jgi:multidrug resistance protein, MATE family
MRSLFRLALPVTLSYLGLMLMGSVDLIAVGRVSAEAVGAVGIGTSVFGWLMITGIGLMAALDYLIGHSYGAGEHEEGFRYFSQAVLVTIFLSAALTGVMVFLSFHLDWLGINPQLRGESESYLRVLAFSLLGALMFNVFRQYLNAVGIARPAVVVMIVANVLNAVANYVLVFGNWGAPAMGAVGSAWATLLARIWMMLAMGLVLWNWDRRNHRFFQMIPIQMEWARMKRLLNLGLPAALQMNFEIGVFAVATGLAARLSAVELAAHQIVLNVASMAFMVPLGVGSAAAVLVGQALGAREPALAVKLGWRAFGLGAGFMTCSCAAFLLFPSTLLGFYTNDPSVIAVGTGILFLAGLFQIADGVQVVGTGALRGLADTRTPMIANLIGHWAIGLPLGAYLCFSAGRGIWGLWVGLASGLVSVALALLIRWRIATRAL